MKKIERILHDAASVVLFVMFVLCILQVVFRFVLKISAPWTEEFARFSYITLVFLMLPVLESNNDQLKVMYFLDKVPYKGRVVIYWFITILNVLFLLIVVCGSFLLATNSTIVKFASTPWLKVNHQYFPILIGSFFGILFVIRRALRIEETFAKDQEEYEV